MSENGQNGKNSYGNGRKQYGIFLSSLMHRTSYNASGIFYQGINSVGFFAAAFMVSGCGNEVRNRKGKLLKFKSTNRERHRFDVSLYCLRHYI
jgi:hypothetical protein